MISKPKTRWMAACFTRAPVSAPKPLLLQVCCDATQHLSQVRAGAAAGVEHVHVLASQPVGDAQVVP